MDVIQCQSALSAKMLAVLVDLAVTILPNKAKNVLEESNAEISVGTGAARLDAVSIDSFSKNWVVLLLSVLL